MVLQSIWSRYKVLLHMIPESHRNTDTPFWLYLPAGIIQKMGVPRGRPNGVTTAVWMKISLTNLISAEHPGAVRTGAPLPQPPLLCG